MLINCIDWRRIFCSLVCLSLFAFEAIIHAYLRSITSVLLDATAVIMESSTLRRPLSSALSIQSIVALIPSHPTTMPTEDVHHYHFGSVIIVNVLENYDSISCDAVQWPLLPLLPLRPTSSNALLALLCWRWACTTHWLQSGTKLWWNAPEFICIFAHWRLSRVQYIPRACSVHL